MTAIACLRLLIDDDAFPAARAQATADAYLKARWTAPRRFGAVAPLAFVLADSRAKQLDAVEMQALAKRSPDVNAHRVDEPYRRALTGVYALGIEPWTAPHAVAIRDLISAADLVKFGGSTDASNGDRQLQLVRDIVARVDRLRRTEIELQTREQGRRKSA